MSDHTMSVAGGIRAVGLSVVLAASCAKEAPSQTAPAPTNSGESVWTGEQRLAHAEEVRKGLEPIAQAFCEQRFACCNADELAFELGPAAKDTTTCVDRIFEWAVLGAGRGGTNSAPIPEILQNFVTVGYAVDPNRVSVDADGAAKCAAYMKKQPCVPSASADPCVAPDAVDDPCAIRTVFRGHQLEGDSCGSGWDSTSVDCAPGLVCHVLAPAHGVCLPDAVEGTLCASSYDCGMLLPCDPKTSTCTRGLAADADCEFRNPGNPVPGTEVTPCRPGLACDISTLKCVTPACAVGCSSDNDCGGRTCTNGQCAPREDPSPSAGPLPPVSVGAACSSGTPCSDTRAYCDGPDGGTGECRARLSRGKPCASSTECMGSCVVDYGELRCDGAGWPSCTGK